MTREEEFSGLVKRQSQFVFRVAQAILHNAHDAEDVVQEVFLKVYRAREWQNIIDERAYLARAAWRLAVTRVQKTQPEATEHDPASSSRDPEQLAISGNWTAVVKRLIQNLPSKLREPLVLSAMEELTSREIAAILGIPEGTVRRRAMEARQTLKEKLRSLTGGNNAKR